MSYAGEFACANHAHIEAWGGHNPPSNAVKNGMQIDAHDKRTPYSFKSVAHCNFLEGRTVTLRDAQSSPRRGQNVSTP